MLRDLHTLLERLRGITLPEVAIREAVQTFIQKEWNEEVPLAAIHVRNGVLSIETANKVLKNELFLKQQTLIDHLRSKFGAKAPSRLG